MPDRFVWVLYKELPNCRVCVGLFIDGDSASHTLAELCSLLPPDPPTLSPYGLDMFDLSLTTEKWMFINRYPQTANALRVGG